MLRGLRLAKVEKVAELSIVTSASIFKPTHPILAGDMSMKTTVVVATVCGFALPVYAASPTTHKFTPPSISKQQEEAYTQTYTSDMAQEKQLKAGGAKTHG